MTPKPVKKINVLFIGAEADPLIKVGGLGDVAGSLPQAIQSLNHDPSVEIQVDIRLALPFHAPIHNTIPSPELVGDFVVNNINGPVPGLVYQITLNGITTYLFDGEPIQQSEMIYSIDNLMDGHKYTFFSMGVLEYFEKTEWKPDIYHANDWHTAPLVYALKAQPGGRTALSSYKSILTVHNLPFMGAGSEDALAEYLPPPNRDNRLPDWAWEQPLPLGLYAADHITTVSPTYASEILTPEFGCGLQDYLKSRGDSVSGILNGLNTQLWDPTNDLALNAKFGPETLEQRKSNKSALLQEFNLKPEPNLPLMILISRMDQQKGVDIAVQALRSIADQPWQAILLGTGNQSLEKSCTQLETEFPDKVRAAIRFDSKLSRRMYAGGDMLLMPSRYEPCGLAQMIGMRYGCVPVARATGGLSDTITDSPQPEKHTGFLFKTASPDAFAETLLRALNTYQNSGTWIQYQANGMKLDFSWEKSARDYIKLYKTLMEQTA